MTKRIRSFFLVSLIISASLSLSGCFLIGNKIIALDQDVEEAQSNIATQYDNKLRRIPELLQIVKASKNAEVEAMVSIIEQRAKAAGQIKLDADTVSDPDKMAQFQKAQAELNAGLGRLMAVSEQYPDLKFPDQFSALMTEIEGANNRITVAQTRYNKAVKEYNTYILSFPGNTVAAKKGYEKKQTFQSDLDVTKPVGAMDLDL
ncbi:MAG: LemA family protein [Treponema sp.]|nr:LemA family protein [Treponema sp.]MBQ7165724.1 LemA family protein [Treponema sp.]